jgi:hypothetical protein
LRPADPTDDGKALFDVFNAVFSITKPHCPNDFYIFGGGDMNLAKKDFKNLFYTTASDFKGFPDIEVHHQALSGKQIDWMYKAEVCLWILMKDSGLDSCF